jgi:hypothetical protein
MLQWSAWLLRALQTHRQFNLQGREPARPTLSAKKATAANHAAILKHLALSIEHIATGARNIARQRNTIVELELRGASSRQARKTLADFERTQVLFLAEHERIREELDAIGSS